MFEKSLVDLIRGLRGHKGSETEYIQSALKECRIEIRSQDMDVKTTAVLKLLYLEMFGYDMAWAAFNVLEVMASAKQLQKRVGYLAAVQTFRPETEVLMLAENLLKKDLASPSIPILSLPLVTLPHVVTPSLALSILSDLLPRLSHSQPAVRKKTVITFYRLALIYPETLRVAWPKIKERLLDEQEDSSVTAATVNVVCELGWRRPQDFLALAPRLFELLISDKNNWMAIKIIKLFAVLTPLEPRLVKKLVRPLTKILHETTAMSLLYECINGIIQGGILDEVDSGVNVEEVADLCISKLRGMIVLEGDPNLKYVALLAFNKIVSSHASLVSMQQDVIMACLDDPDISIKMQALELVSGMVNSDNVQAVVDRLMKQLAKAPKDQVNGTTAGLYDEDNTDLEQKLIPDKRSSEAEPLPDEYRYEIVSRILNMCSNNSYSNITDFEWYIEVLVHLVRQLPASKAENVLDFKRTNVPDEKTSLAYRIGNQILDIAVRVKELRPDSTKAAETLLLISNRPVVFASHHSGQNEILKSAAWICGEFSQHLISPHEVLNSLVHESSHSLSATTLSIYVQSLAKIVARIISIANRDWNVSRATTISLSLARTTNFLEKLSEHPNLEVQERSVEFLELLKLASEALNSQTKDSLEAPFLLTSAIPNLFSGLDLNPVAIGAQKKVPIPEGLDLDTPINSDLTSILQASQIAESEDLSDTAFHSFYYEREPVSTATTLRPQQSNHVSESIDSEPSSYQSAPESPKTRARRRAERMARNKDDPFYIPPSGSGHSSARTSPPPSSLAERNEADDDLDLDSIPIIDLQLGNASSNQPSSVTTTSRVDTQKHQKKRAPRSFVIAADESIDDESDTHQQNLKSSTPIPQRSQSPTSSLQQTSKPTRPTRNLLSVDSSGLGSFSLEGPSETDTAFDFERREAEEAEMAAALREVELKRLEMQRDIERGRTAMAEGVDLEGTIIKRKKKKKPQISTKDPEAVGTPNDQQTGDVMAGDVVKKKKKKKKRKELEPDQVEVEPQSSTTNDPDLEPNQITTE